MAELSRRKLLSGQWRRPSNVQRPPWAREEALFISGCSRCRACIDACETGVLIAGGGGYPEIDFSRAECSFCRRCVSACDAGVFDAEADRPWRLQPSVSMRCLALQGVECRSCQDGCDTGAIRFRPRLGGIAQPVLTAAACSGCGACVAPCPTDAIALTRSENNE